MDKVAEFYARWFAKKAAQEYWAAEAASEELAKELIGVHESNKRDFWQSCAVKFLHGTILHLSSKAHLKGEERMTLWKVIAFLEVQPIEKSWKELMVSQASEEDIGRIAAEAGELMLNSPGPAWRLGCVSGGAWESGLVAAKGETHEVGRRPNQNQKRLEFEQSQPVLCHIDY